MRAGELDRLITIEQPTETKDSQGSVSTTWSEFATVWAKRMPGRADEYFAAQQMNAPVDAVFRIRWVSGLSAKMRILYDSQYYEILSFTEIGRHEGYEIAARVLSA